jgi:hypothetical protein
MSDFSTPTVRGFGPPDIRFGMPDADYRSALGVANSDLKKMEQSPAHYRAHMLAKGTPSKPTPAQVFGTVLHGALLEPERVLHVVRPEGLSFQTKEGKAWRDAQTLPILSAEEGEDIAGATAAMQAHPIASAILHKAQKEVSVFSRCMDTGIALKGRLDLVFQDESGRTVVADIKTCEDAREFPRDARKWGYHRQAAWYLDLLGVSAFLFVAVEKTAPYGIRVFQLDEESLERGREIYRANLRTLRECTGSAKWSGYSDEIQPLTIRPWKEAQ